MRRLGECLVRHVWVDLLTSLALGCLVSFFSSSHYFSTIIDLSDSACVALSSGLSALAGIILAVATFVCTALIQTNNSLFKKIWEKYHADLNRNIVVMILFNLVSAVLPLFAIILKSKTIGLTIALFSMFLLIHEAVRVMWWIKFFLRVNIAANNFEVPLETSEQRVKKLKQQRNFNNKAYDGGMNPEKVDTR